MINQARHFDICSVVNNRQTGEMILHVQIRGYSVSNVHLDSEKVEGLCFPLLFPYGEPGFTNMIKHRLSPDSYVMSRLLRPKKRISGNYMTAKQITVPINLLIVEQENQLRTRQVQLRSTNIKCREK